MQSTTYRLRPAFLLISFKTPPVERGLGCNAQPDRMETPHQVTEVQEKRAGHDEMNGPYSARDLAGLLAALVLGHGLGMIGNSFYLGLIHGLSSRRVKVGTRRNDPVFGGLCATAARTYFDTAGVDALLSLTAGEVRFGIDGSFCRQVLAFLPRTGIAHYDQLVIWVLLQVLRNIIQDRLAGIVDPPGLLLIGEVALAELGGLGRRWWRILHHHLCRALRSQATSIGCRCIHRDCPGRGAGCVQGGSVVAATDGTG